MIGIDCIGSCKSNYHAITDTTAPKVKCKIHLHNPGADPGFQVRGGALKKIALSGGRREIFWGISCEKSLFYAKKSYFLYNCGGRRENFWGISCEKSRFYAKKSYFFQF